MNGERAIHDRAEAAMPLDPMLMSYPIDIVEDTDHALHTEVVALDEPYVLSPGETIHGITRETISLPSDLCGFLEGRSRFARLGLMIHVTSAMVQPGVNNRQVLEMSNVSTHPLRIHAGVRVCQLVPDVRDERIDHLLGGHGSCDLVNTLRQPTSEVFTRTR